MDEPTPLWKRQADQQTMNDGYLSPGNGPAGHLQGTDASTPAQKVGRALNATRNFLGSSYTKARAVVGPAITKAQKFAREHPANAPGAHSRMTGLGGMGGGMDFGFTPDFGDFGAMSPTLDPSDDFKKRRRGTKRRGASRKSRSYDDYMDYINRF